MSVIKSKALVATGVGRKDYSQNVEFAVEPQIRSWQSEYRRYMDLEVPAGGTIVTEIDIVEKTVVMLYDVYLSAPLNSMLRIKLDFFSTTGTWEQITDKTDLQTVEIHYARGFPLFDKYRITVTNYGTTDLTGDHTASFSAHGIVTAEEEYYGRLLAAP